MTSPYLIAKSATIPMLTLFIRRLGEPVYSACYPGPFSLWIWATLYQPERGWGMQSHVTPQRK